jgi:hypothetical protein
MEKGLRYNEGKLQWSLVDLTSFEGMVRVLMFGAQKYSRENWKKGLNILEIMDSMLRHLSAMMRGELIDPETGLPHNSHLQCNTMFFDYMVRTGATYEEALKELNEKDAEQRRKNNAALKQPVGMDYARSQVRDGAGAVEVAWVIDKLHSIWEVWAVAKPNNNDVFGNGQTVYTNKEIAQRDCNDLNEKIPAWWLKGEAMWPVLTNAASVIAYRPESAWFLTLNDALTFALTEINEEKAINKAKEIWQVGKLYPDSEYYAPIIVAKPKHSIQRTTDMFDMYADAVKHAIHLNNLNTNKNAGNITSSNA